MPTPATSVPTIHSTQISYNYMGPHPTILRTSIIKSLVSNKESDDGLLQYCRKMSTVQYTITINEQTLDDF